MTFKVFHVAFATHISELTQIPLHYLHHRVYLYTQGLRQLVELPPHSIEKLRRFGGRRFFWEGPDLAQLTADTADDKGAKGRSVRGP